MNLSPILTMASPFFRNIYHSKIQHFQKTFIGRKYGFGFCDLPALTVKSLHGIRGIDQMTDRFRIFEIGREICCILRSQRTLMRFRADTIRIITDALNHLLLWINFWA